MRKLGPLMDPTIIDGGRVTLAGDVTGPSDGNVVERLTGAAGVVTLPGGSTIEKVPPNNANSYFARMNFSTGRKFEFGAYTTVAPDDTVFLGYTPVGNAPNSALYFEGESNTFGDGGKTFETYILCASANPPHTYVVPFYSAFEWDVNGGTGTLGDCVTNLSSGNGKGIGFLDKTAGVNRQLVAIENIAGTGFNFAVTVNGNVSLGDSTTVSATTTAATNQRVSGTVIVDSTTVSGGVTAVTTVGAALTSYSIIASVAGQKVQLEATGGGGAAINLYAINGSITTTGNLQLGSLTGAFGGGTTVVGVTDASVVPTTNPAGGGILYSASGQGAWRRSDGTVIGFG